MSVLQELEMRMAHMDIDGLIFTERLHCQTALLRRVHPSLPLADAMSYALAGIFSSVPLTKDYGDVLLRDMEGSDPRRRLLWDAVCLARCMKASRHEPSELANDEDWDAWIRSL